MVVPPVSQPTSPSGVTSRSSITLVFDKGGSTCILRPNAVVRGQVELKLIKPCYASGIRVRLKAEESAIVLGQESNGDTVRQKYHQTVITLFDTEVMVSGLGQNDNELSNWKEITPGTYSYPFALKVPNVNFPPCIPSLDGFSIRYVWTAHVDGPFEGALSSEEVLCQFLPSVLAPKPMEWTYHDTLANTLTKNSTHQLHKPAVGIDLSLKMQQQIYVPGDPLSIVATLVNSTQNKIIGIDITLRRTVKGIFSTSYANLSNQAQSDVMTTSVECKVRGGETGQVDIMTTIPPLGKTFSIPTFESNFLKVYYELICTLRVKRSVFSGGDTTYQSILPIPIATHNVDNPIVTGRTPRWTKSRLQPYFFDSSSSNPIGDLPVSAAEEYNTSPVPVSATAVSYEAPYSTSPTNGSAVSLLSPTGTGSYAMQEFLSGGSAELHRERTLKKSLTRSKSLKDIQSARLNGSSWRAERDQLINQSREMSSSNKTSTDTSQFQNPNGKRSPPITPKGRSSNDDKQLSIGVDSNGDVPYTPPPPSSTQSTTRPPKSANRDLTPEQQAELARKASRRILPNQGSYTNEGVLPSEYIQSESSNQTQASGSYNTTNSRSDNTNTNDTSNSSSGVSYPVPLSSNSQAPLAGSNVANRIPPKRNASLSQKSYPQPNNGSTGSFVTDQETNTQYEYSRRANNSSSDTANSRFGQDQLPSNSERTPYQHSLPAHQQPPGVINPAAIASLNSPPYGVSNPVEEVIRSPKKNENVSVSSGGGNISTNEAMGSPSFTKILPWERVEKVHHQDWFRPAPHQTGALQTFDVAGISLSHQHTIPVMKKTLQRPFDNIQSIEVEDQLR
ncbi:hypothetical protein BGZ76_010583 [Entomortierella beljakovae]|nr:hypothetical protein BGZ76_010583 [Entomortierella beljakovae]